jgi:hypothetical protein
LWECLPEAEAISTDVPRIAAENAKRTAMLLFIGLDNPVLVFAVEGARDAWRILRFPAQTAVILRRNKEFYRRSSVRRYYESA